MTREPIYAALASLVFGAPAIQAIFVTYGRWLRHFSQVTGGSGSFPAIYLAEHPGERVQRMGKGIPPKRTLECRFFMYFWTVDAAAIPWPTPVGSILPATQCNNALDALDAILNPSPSAPSNTITLGGLVEHVYTEGAVVVDEGLLQEVSIVVVPVTMLIP